MRLSMIRKCVVVFLRDKRESVCAEIVLNQRTKAG